MQLSPQLSTTWGKCVWLTTGSLSSAAEAFKTLLKTCACCCSRLFAGLKITVYKPGFQKELKNQPTWLFRSLLSVVSFHLWKTMRVNHFRTSFIGSNNQNSGLPDAILRVVFTVNVTAEPFPCQPAHWRGPHYSIVQGESGHRKPGNKQKYFQMHS